MPLNNEVLLAATKIVLQWGPERQTPEAERLRNAYPNLTDAEIQQALRAGHEVIQHAEELAPKIKERKLHSGSEVLRKKRPWLDDETADSAITQGLYYHWRETGE